MMKGRRTLPTNLRHLTDIMKDKDTKLIFEAYVTEREYGPSGAPSINPEEWELMEIYGEGEWQGGTPNPWDKYMNKILADVHGEDDTFIMNFSARRPSRADEDWTDAGIVVAVTFDRESHLASDWSFPIFVDNDGEGESHVLPKDVAKILIDTHDDELIKYATKDDESGSWDPYGPDGVVSRSDFMPRGDF